MATKAGVSFLFMMVIMCPNSWAQEAHTKASKTSVFRKSLSDAFDSADVDDNQLLSVEEFSHFVISRDVPPSSGLLDSSLSSFTQAQQKVVKFWGAAANSLAMIIVTELGDKTFFIAAIMAMRYPRLLVFGGAIGALAVMTALSSMIGFALPNVLPHSYTHYASAVLFLYFGIKLTREGYQMVPGADGSVNEEMVEAEAEISEKERSSIGNIEDGGRTRLSTANVFFQAFSMTFLAEWGDRSQIATIALASAKDPYGVTLGGTAGHAICTGLAVVGGKLLAARISEKTVALSGGVLFLLFALHAVVAGP